MKKKNYCIGIIILIISGTLGVFMIPENPIDDVEVEDDMASGIIYDYVKLFDITSDWYPINTHLSIEYSTYIYFVPLQNTLTIRKLDTSDGTSSLIVTEGGTITKFYYDSANDRLYYYYNQINFSYVNLTDDSITDLTPTLAACEDLFVYSGDLFAVDTSADDLTYYIYNAGGPSWDAVGTIAEGDVNYYDIGALSGNDEPMGICWDGTYFYVVDFTDRLVYKYNAALDTEITTIDIVTESGGDNREARGICFDGTNFYIIDNEDAKVYYYDSSFNFLSSNLLNVGNADPIGACWDGTYFYVTDTTDFKVYKYAADFSTFITSYDIGALLVGLTSVAGIEWDGTYFYIIDDNEFRILQLSADFSVLVSIFNLNAIGDNNSPYGITWDDNYFFTTDLIEGKVFQYTENIKTELGSILYSVIIDDDVWLVYQYIGQDAKIYSKDLDDSSNPILKETLASDLLIPNLENQRGIAVSNDSDVLYFVMKDADDGLTYLCTYVISTDTFTKGSTYNIALMLDRNSIGTTAPFDTEKGFHVSSLYVYQISKNASTPQVYKIEDLTDLTDFSGYTIKAITDTYLIVYNETNSFVAKYQDNASKYLQIWVKNRLYWYNKVKLLETQIQINSDIVVEIYDDNDALLFRGKVHKEFDEENVKEYSANGLEKADLDSSYTGAHTTADLATMAQAIFNDGRFTYADATSCPATSITITLNFINYLKRDALEVLAILANGLWYIEPNGYGHLRVVGADVTSKVTDSGITTSQATGDLAPPPTTKRKWDPVNYVEVYGSLDSSTGTRLTSIAQIEADVTANGKREWDGTVNFPCAEDQTALDQISAAILAYNGVGDNPTSAQFGLKQPDRVQAGQYLSLEFSYLDALSVAADYPIEKVLMDVKANQATLFVSTGLLESDIS